MGYDLVIRNGFVVDGSGLAGYRAEVHARDLRATARAREGVALLDPGAEFPALEPRHHSTRFSLSTCESRL